MKILHTSDWHLGQHFYRFDRDDEHEHFVKQLSEIVLNEKPDAVIVSGDVFDNAVPSVMAQSRFVRSVLDLHESCPDSVIVITAGNHDSGNRLDVHRPVWDRLGVKVIGSCHRADDGTFDADEFIVPVGDKGYIVAVPYFHTCNFPLANADISRENRQQKFFEKVMDAVGKRNRNALPVVLMAHLAVEGCDIQGHEDSFIGGMEMESLSKLGSGFDYLALGHIHKPQSISDRVRYCGSPIPLSFSEDYVHSVTVVELGRHGELPSVSWKNIVPLRKMQTIVSGSLEEALLDLERVNEDVYVRLLIDQDGILPADAEQRAQLVAKDKLCRLCEVRKLLRKREREDVMDDGGIDVVQTGNAVTPIDIAKRHYRRAHCTEMPDELTALMENVISEVING